MRNRNRAMSRSATAAATAAADTMTTLWFRLPILFSTPSFESGREWHRALTEKMEAVAVGTFAATLEAQKVAFQAATGRLSAEAMPTAALRITEAALDPGFRAVAANAKRLARAR